MPVNTLFTTNNFKKHFKKVRRNPRWFPIFTKPSRYDGTSLPPWDFVINCLIMGMPIPYYFYAHPLTIYKKLTQQIKAAVGPTSIEIKLLDLHFDDHNGDHVLVYCAIYAEHKIVLVDIGSNADLFG